MKSREKWWKRCKWLAVALFFGAFGWLLYSRARDMDWAEVWTSVRAFEAQTLAMGLGFALIAYLAFGCYDLLARRHLKHRVPAPRVLAIAMVAYALNLNLGALIGGWASRFRLYSRVGVDAGMTTRIIGFGLLSNWSGYLLLAGLVFLLAPPQLPQSWHLNAGALPFIGGALLVAVALYLLACAFRPGKLWKIRRLELRTPHLGSAGLQFLASTVHWLATCMVVSQFLPDEIGFTTILGVMMMSAIAGAAMHVPAGLGVIEAVYVATLGDRFPPAQLLAGLLAYRATFYLIPLLLALAVYPFLEVRGRVRAGSAAAANWAKG